ncbi:hypothetical protein RvY_09619 [Ramazzottius varieornatus]|uniref:Uncharacterized protein n=1 Tax=Ramazzottius varieornatus TaxID=947166 RepID=A0A1D1VC52_RAMVA|nr:hypothetical protein RvY_09619 [Ramazzottius varieornatus]
MAGSVHPNSKLRSDTGRPSPSSPQKPEGYSEALASSPFAEAGSFNSKNDLTSSKPTLSPQNIFKANQKAGEMAVHKARDTHRASLNPDQRRLIPQYAATTIAALRTKSTTDTEQSQPPAK